MAGFKFFSTAFAGQFERLADRVFTGLNHLIAFPALDPMPVQGCLPLFFLRRQLRGREVESPDKFQIDVYLLRPVTVYLFWGVDDDPLNKLVYHRRGQFRKIRVLLCQGEEPFHIGGVLLKAVQRRFRLHDGLTERRLLLLVPGKEGVKSFLAYAPHRIGFVQLPDDGVQFLTPPLVLVQSALQIFCRLRLPDFGRSPDLLDKLALIGNGVGAGRADGFQNQCPQSLGGDVVIAAGTAVILPGQRVSGAVEPVRWIGLGGVSPRPMVIQLRAAVGAVEKPGQGIGLADGVVAAGRFPQFLGKLPGLLIHDSLMGVFKPCVDKRDAAQKHRDKVKQCAENPKIIANKRRKKLDISKQPPVSKNLRTKDAKSAIYGRSKLAIHLPPK